MERLGGFAIACAPNAHRSFRIPKWSRTIDVPPTRTATTPTRVQETEAIEAGWPGCETRFVTAF